MTAAAKKLTIFIDENDMRGDVPLYEFIIRRLITLEAAGATVQVGIMGFGKHGRVHRKRLFGISDDRPVSIVVVDSGEKVEFLAQELQPLITEGLMMVEDVTLVRADPA